jgi:hypothetical protein
MATNTKELLDRLEEAQQAVDEYANKVKSAFSALRDHLLSEQGAPPEPEFQQQETEADEPSPEASASTPNPGIEAISGHGVSARTAKTLRDQGITTVGALNEALKNGSIGELKGIGKTKIEKLSAAVERILGKTEPQNSQNVDDEVKQALSTELFQIMPDDSKIPEIMADNGIGTLGDLCAWLEADLRFEDLNWADANPGEGILELTDSIRVELSKYSKLCQAKVAGMLAGPQPE